jgi:hypothetical protein
MGKYGFQPTGFLDNLQRRIFTNKFPRRFVVYTDTEFNIEPVFRACYYQSCDNSPIIPIDDNFNIVKIPRKLKN